MVELDYLDRLVAQRRSLRARVGLSRGRADHRALEVLLVGQQLRLLPNRGPAAALVEVLELPLPQHLDRHLLEQTDVEER